ncbi:MAG TPA: S8 family serine peptidase [Streptosporangiaceae bacterium]|nr:S8 family serine peptidase [Streptosporangiaceae bacterium]
MRRPPPLTRRPGSRPRHRSALLVAIAATALAAAQAGTALATPAASASRAAAWQPLTTSEAAKLSVHVNRHVIVFMKNQPALAPGRPVAMAARSAAITASQAPLLRELRETHATRILTYHLVNSFAATVSAGEEARLRANPSVAKVIPDEVIQGPAVSQAGAVGTAKSAPVKPITGACPAHGKAQLEPEGLSLTGVASSSAGAKTARSLGINGAGVTVAWIADGLDPNNVNFIRQNGTSAFSFYEDFTGDGTKGPSGAGGEAFGDANTIGGQGLHVYNVQKFSTQGLTVPCNVRIEGVAPGASIEGLRVFGFSNSTTTSAFLDAINFATVVHPADVINESFGENGFPDSNTTDALKEFDNAAVALGITVVVSSGDSSPSSTIGSPATDPEVISAAATTDLRSYAMSNYGQADMFARGWLNNNIAPFSSGGFDAYGNTVDVSAPGDSSFASCSKNLKFFPECRSFGGKATGVELFGGTSEASPWIAGVAALVYQAYRKTHSGNSPSPALVKQIIMSTSTNLGAPAYEQGAGLVNAYKAVQLAESFGLPHGTGSTLLTTVNGVSPTNPSPRQGQINGIGSPGTPVTATVDVTNTGASSQVVHVAGKTFGPANNVQNSKVVLSDAKSKKFVDAFGFVNNYAETHFTVRPGESRLVASIAYPAKTLNFNAAVRFDLITPSGKLALQSEPQGTSNFTTDDVLHPQAGRWTVVIFDLTAKKFGTTGTIRFQASTQKLVPFGQVSRSSFRLGAGQTGSFTFTTRTPSSPGDAAGSVDINSGSIAVTLRSLVDLSSGGSFSGTLTGGNGRDDLPGNGQINYYEFDVPSGSPNVSASVDLANDGARQINAYLVDPAGEIAGFGSNYRLAAVSSKGAFSFATSTHMDVYAANAIPGTWTLVVDFNDPALATPGTGNEVSQHYSGQIKLSSLVSASAAALPDSADTTESGPLTVPVTITNHGKSPENFFLDPRLDGSSVYPLIGENTTDVPVPLPAGQNAPEWLVPTETSELAASATSTIPMTFDLGEFADGADPDVASFTPGSTAGSTTPSLTVTTTAGALSPGLWAGAQAPSATNGFVNPSPAKGTATFTVNVTTQTFDPGASSAVGDFWLGTVSSSAKFNPLFTIQPGQSRTIDLTITPSADGTAGTVVHGTLYVDVFAAFNEIQLGGLTGSDVIGIPYEYTIG